MRAARLADGGLALDDAPEPAPGPGEVLVQVALAGVCGTDLHAVEAGIEAGTVLGHEFTGSVLALGSGVAGLTVGQRVVSLPVRSCGRCRACLTGDLLHCSSALLVGNQPEAPGAFAERVVVGAEAIVVLPDTVREQDAALAEPLAVALHVLRRAGASATDSVLVVGAGPIGLAVTLWLRHLGARRIVVSDPVAARREMARGCGATDVLDPAGGSVGSAWRGLGMPRPDLVVECTGRDEVLQQCLDVLPRLGRLAVAGMHNSPTQVSFRGAFFKELSVVFASWYEKSDFEYTVELLADRRLDPAALRVDVVTLEQLPRTFETLREPGALGKVLVNPGA